MTKPVSFYNIVSGLLLIYTVPIRQQDFSHGGVGLSREQEQKTLVSGMDTVSLLPPSLRTKELVQSHYTGHPYQDSWFTKGHQYNRLSQTQSHLCLKILGGDLGTYQPMF